MWKVPPPKHTSVVHILSLRGDASDCVLFCVPLITATLPPSSPPEPPQTPSLSLAVCFQSPSVSGHMSRPHDQSWEGGRVQGEMEGRRREKMEGGGGSEVGRGREKWGGREKGREKFEASKEREEDRGERKGKGFKTYVRIHTQGPFGEGVKGGNCLECPLTQNFLI